jgi:hypothetical protein
MKRWSSVYLGGSGLLVLPAEWQVITFLPSVGIWRSCSLAGEPDRLFCCQGRWGELGLHALGEGSLLE